MEKRGYHGLVRVRDTGRFWCLGELNCAGVPSDHTIEKGVLDCKAELIPPVYSITMCIICKVVVKPDGHFGNGG